MKQCSKCREFKDEACFSIDNSRKSHLFSQCKECVRKRHQTYNKVNREKLRDKLREWRRKTPHKQKEYDKKYYLKGGKERAKVKRLNYQKLWLQHFDSNPICEICDKKLEYFAKTKHKHYVCFDHRIKNLPIRCNPSTWLGEHPPSPNNIKIWDTCNFGILCNRCNSKLLLTDRENWLIRAFGYTYEFNRRQRQAVKRMRGAEVQQEMFV